METEWIPNPHHDKEAWLKFKRRRIGGHAAVTLSGASYSSTDDVHYQTPNQLYDLIVHGIVDPITKEKERFFAWRLKQEPLIAEVYAEITGRKLRRCGSGLHPENEMLMYSPDREILKDPRGLGLLEIKSRDPMAWRAIKLNGIPGADYVQEQFYQMCKGVIWGAICQGNLSTGELIHIDIDSNLDFQAALYGKICKFIDDCAKGIRPPEVVANPTKIPVVGGELVTIEQMDGRLVREFTGIAAAALEARNLRDRAKAYYDDVKAASQKWMEGNKFDVVEGFGARIYNKETKGKKKTDMKALKRDHPEIDLTKYESRGKSSRRFVVYDRPLAITSENGD